MAKPTSPTVGQKVFDSGRWYLCTAITPWVVWRIVPYAGPKHTPAATPPADATIGDWWTSTISNAPHLFTGDEWVRMGGSSAARYAEGETPDTATPDLRPFQGGDRWYKPSEGRVHEMINNVWMGV